MTIPTMARAQYKVSMLHTNTNILSVSQLNQQVNQMLSRDLGLVWLEAEIGQLTKAASGHWYLTLKDPSSQVRCAMFRQRNRQVSWVPKLGDQVLVKAQVGLYEPRGEYQLIIEAMQPAGVGRLQQAFEQLKAELQNRGWFAAESKKPLPESIQRVGLVTSATGAAIHDMLTVMQRRDASVVLVIYPTQVQGSGAAEQIAQQIQLANLRAEVDLLIVSRGGGSLEDLWSFNTLEVAQAIFQSQLPVISAVGHEVDVTIADWVADVRAPTPSAAAELVTSDFSERENRLMALFKRLQHGWQSQLQQAQLRLSRYEHRLAQQAPQHKLQQQMQRTDELTHKLDQAMRRKLTANDQRWHRLHERLSCQSPAIQLKEQRQKLMELNHRLSDAMATQLHQRDQAVAVLMAKLDVVSPLATLSRGYSISQTREKQVIRSINDVKVGDELVTLVADGQFSATINSVTPKVADQ